MAGRQGLFAVAATVFAVALLAAQSRSLAQESSLAAAAIELVNAARAAEGLSPLATDPALCEAARSHAQDMLDRDYFDHRSPEGRDVMDRFIAAGGTRWLGVAENILRCASCPEAPDRQSLEAMLAQWMDSPGHRAAILSSRHERFCFGVAWEAPKGYAAVQTFAGPGLPRASTTPGGRAGDRAGNRAGEPAADPKAISIEAMQVMALEMINEQRRAKGRIPLEVSTTLASDAAAFLEDVVSRDPDGREPLSAKQVRQHLTGHENGHWLRVDTLLVACGGCGRVPTDTDIAFFVGSWSSRETQEDTLLNRKFDSFGFAIVADGRGRKIALGLFGDRGG